jgi:hypothetical protein
VSVRQAGPLVPLGTGYLLDEGASSPVNAFPSISLPSHALIATEQGVRSVTSAASVEVAIAARAPARIRALRISLTPYLRCWSGRHPAASASKI